MIRIAGLLTSPSLAPTKLDELKIKANILSSFIAQKAEDAYDQTAEAFFDAAGKVQEGAEAVKDKVEEKAREIKAEL
jgi:protein disulfide-isomerase A6